MRALLYGFMIVVFAGLTHIASLYVLPATLKKDAFFRLSEASQPGGMTLIAPDLVAEWPFFDPAMALGVCRYDLANGPFRVRTRLSESFLTLVLADPERGIFSNVNERAATGGMLDVVIATKAQLLRIIALDDAEEAVAEIRIEAEAPQGLALLKVLVDRESARPMAEAIINAAQCSNETLP